MGDSTEFARKLITPYAERVEELEEENDKLRELVRDLWARRDSLLDFGFYADVAEQLDKLGIEVEP